jgi:hypothetical protein
LALQQGNLMPTPNVLGAKSETQVDCLIFRQLVNFRAERILARCALRKTDDELNALLRQRLSDRGEGTWRSNKDVGNAAT